MSKLNNDGKCPMCQGKLKEIFIIYEGATTLRVKVKCEVCELEFATWRNK